MDKIIPTDSRETIKRLIESETKKPIDEVSINAYTCGITSALQLMKMGEDMKMTHEQMFIALGKILIDSFKLKEELK